MTSLIPPANLKEKVIEVLRTVHDPEIPVNIFELGLIYEIEIAEEKKVHIRMTLTAPACPIADSIVEEVKEKVSAIEEVSETNVELVFDPPWDYSLMSEAAKLELGFL